MVSPGATFSQLIWQNKKILFTLLFDTAAATLLEVAADPKHLGAEISFLSILHTWGQTLQPHPHIHCVVPGGGLSPDHERWLSTPAHFFLAARVLSRVFRGKFVAGLRRAFRTNQLAFHGECLLLANEKNYAAFLRTLFREEWVVGSKPPFGGSEHVLHFLARYTHRVAISNHRILAVNDSQVTFLSKDYAHHNKQRTMTLTCEEFLRRFPEHLLRRGFSRIRYFGWLANRRRSKLLPLGRVLLPHLRNTLPQPDSASPPSGVVLAATHRCPCRNGCPPHCSIPKGDRNASLTLPNLQLAFTLNRWPSTQLLGVCPYVWKVIPSSVDDLIWHINVHPKSEFSVSVLPRRRCFWFFPYPRNTIENAYIVAHTPR